MSACCHPEDHADEPTTTVLAPTDDCCGPCVDIPLIAAPPAVFDDDLDLTFEPSVLTATLPALLIVAPAPRLEQRPSTPPSPPHALSALRTVVLTC